MIVYAHSGTGFSCSSSLLNMGISSSQTPVFCGPNLADTVSASNISLLW